MKRVLHREFGEERPAAPVQVGGEPPVILSDGRTVLVSKPTWYHRSTYGLDPRFPKEQS